MSLLKVPLQEQGVSYKTMRGGLLSGFVLEDVNYKNQVQAKKVTLKVDWRALENRVLIVDDLVLEDAEIEQNFLASLLESNGSESNNSEGNVTLPFDKILVHNADISLKNVVYDAYRVNYAKLHIDNLETDMKENHQGAITFLLDSNVSKIDLKGSFKNKNYDVIAKVEGEKSFIEPFLAETNVTFFSNPNLTIHAKGDLQKVHYDVEVHRLDVRQNSYEVHSQKLHTVGEYYIGNNKLVNALQTELTSNVGALSLRSDVSVDIDDINHTLRFDVNGKFLPKKSHLLSGLVEQNITIEQFPSMFLLAKGDMKLVNFSTQIMGLKAQQNEMKLELKKLKVKGVAKPLEGDINFKGVTSFDSSVAGGLVNLTSQLNYKDINNTLKFDTDADLEIHSSYVNNFLRDANVTLEGSSHFKLVAKGDMKNVAFSTSLNGVRGKENNLAFHLKDLDVKGSAKPLHGDINLKAYGKFDSSVADGLVNLSTTLNYKDINNTLTFNTDANLQIHNAYVNNFVEDVNVTLEGESQLNLTAKGGLDNVLFTTLLKGVKGKQNDITFALNDLSIKGESSPLQGDTSVVALTHFTSSVADGEIDAKVRLNFNDINNTLELNTLAKLDAHADYVNPFVKEQGISLQGDSHLTLKAEGKLDSLTLNVDAKADVLKDKKRSLVSIHSSPMVLNIFTHHITGSLDVKSEGGDIGLNLKTNFDGDYTKPQEMQIKNKIEVGSFSAFGLDLSSLEPLALDVQNRDGGLVIGLDSPKIKLMAESKDNDHFTFDLKTDPINLSKIIELPKELKNKLIAINLAGKVTLSKQYFVVSGWVKSNENFKLLIDAKNSVNGLDAKLSTKHLKLFATGDIEKRDIQAQIKIDSVEKLQEELVALYPFEMVKVDGALEVQATLKGEKITALLNSKKLKFDGFNIENLKLNGGYANELITINTFNFQTTGFSDKSLNEKFYLNQKGLIHLGKKRDILLDMHPNIKIKARGTAENLKGDFKISKLPVGHPEYGSMVLNCDVHYQQTALKKKIIGEIKLDKMNLLYEAKFLDADYDSDVVIINKKDKNKKKEQGSFLADTFIDLSINAPYAKYRTRDVDLEFTVDLNAKKEFGSPLGMLGKIKEINGRVEQAPKLFNVVDSNIIFGGGKENNPLLDIQVDYELPDVLITILVHGHAKRPKLDFSSEPPMPKKDILSYLLLGVSTAALAEGEGSLGREAELFIMNQAARDFAYELELDRVFIKDDGTGEGYAVQVGKKIDDKTMFVIENSKEGNSFILEYEVNKHLKVEVGQHQKTVPSQSIDLYFRKKFK